MKKKDKSTFTFTVETEIEVKYGILLSFIDFDAPDKIFTGPIYNTREEATKHLKDYEEDAKHYWGNLKVYSIVMNEDEVLNEVKQKYNLPNIKTYLINYGD